MHAVFPFHSFREHSTTPRSSAQSLTFSSSLYQLMMESGNTIRRRNAVKKRPHPSETFIPNMDELDSYALSVYRSLHPEFSTNRHDSRARLRMLTGSASPMVPAEEAHVVYLQRKLTVIRDEASSASFGPFAKPTMRDSYSWFLRPTLFKNQLTEFDMGLYKKWYAIKFDEIEEHGHPFFLALFWYMMHTFSKRGLVQDEQVALNFAYADFDMIWRFCEAREAEDWIGVERLLHNGFKELKRARDGPENPQVDIMPWLTLPFQNNSQKEVQPKED